MRVRANLTLSFKCNFLVSFLIAKQKVFLLWVVKPQNETISILCKIASRIKVTKSDQSDQGTQIGQTCIKLLTLIYFCPKTLRWRFFMLFHNIFIYHHQLVWWPLRVPGGTRVISHQSETISKFAFHNPHNFTQHSKGRINPNFDNVSTWQCSHGRNNKKYAFCTFSWSSTRVHKNSCIYK